MTARKLAKLEADPAYNAMLLAFRDANFRLAAYRALVWPRILHDLAKKMAADIASIRNAAAEVCINELAAAAAAKQVADAVASGSNLSATGEAHDLQWMKAPPR